MIKFILLLAFATTGMTANAQLVPGSMASDFTFTDINGTTHHLYDYLDQGKTVFLDASTAWCGPCWNYHNSHALRDLYEHHGPAGYPGVAATTTDDVIVLFIEAELTNTGAQITGTVAGNDHTGETWGDWTAGTPYPIIDVPSDAAGLAFISDYEIEHYPTIIKICPNRRLMLVERWPAEVLYQSVYSCSASSQEVDVVALRYTGTDRDCDGNFLPQVKIQNNGSVPLTNATITLMSGNTILSTGTYTGSLGSYEMTDVTCPWITVFDGGTVDIIVTADSDANATNGLLQQQLFTPQLVPSSITVNVYTDFFPRQNNWEIWNSANQIVASGGLYWAGPISGGGPDALTTKSHEVTLPPVADCYSVHLFDGWGNGMMIGENPAGHCGLEVISWGEVKYACSGVFNEEAIGEAAFYTDATSGLTDLSAPVFSVYPNPASDNLSVAFTAINPDYTVVLTDLQGRVLTHTAYSGLSGEQVIELPIDTVAAGNYLVRVTTNGFSSVKAVVVQ
jgi:hypothetical protein